jgi:2-(1,2-epoxy-1,2-dihydrophenyl)acetyl-CoA isomerase
VNVLTTVSDGVATVTLNRPDSLNALDETTRSSLTGAIRAASRDPEIGAIVITGAGRAFCAGQDLGAIHELDDAEDTVARTYNPIAIAIAESDVPVVAAVNGAAVGAGMGIALGCDIVIMSEKASFACVFGKVGLVPDTGTSWFLVRTVGYLRAYDLAVSGRRVAADEAVSLGLATELAAPDALAARAQERAAELAAGPRLAWRLTRAALRSAVAEDLAGTLALEARSQGLAARDPEHVRRRDAFLAR